MNRLIHGGLLAAMVVSLFFAGIPASTTSLTSAVEHVSTTQSKSPKIKHVRSHCDLDATVVVFTLRNPGKLDESFMVGVTIGDTQESQVVNLRGHAAEEVKFDFVPGTAGSFTIQVFNALGELVATHNGTACASLPKK